MMTICVAGKNNIAVDVLEYLIANNNNRYRLMVICNELRTELPGWQKSLYQVATNHGIDNVALEDTYDIDNLLFLSMEYDRLVKPERFRNARLYNIHFSLLPAYKGMYTSAIPILNGEKYTGVTLHKIESGIDTGDIIAQRKIEISNNDTCRDLYQKYLSEGARLTIDNLEDIIAFRETFTPQPAEGASYYPKSYIDYSNLNINMNDVAVQVERQIRAFSFKEYQMPEYGGYTISKAEILHEKSIEKPGVIVSDDDSAIVVATIDYNVKLYKEV